MHEGSKFAGKSNFRENKDKKCASTLNPKCDNEMKDYGVSQVMHCRNKQNMSLLEGVVVYDIFHIEMVGKSTLILTQSFLISYPFFCTFHELQLDHVLTNQAQMCRLQGKVCIKQTSW